MIVFAPSLRNARRLSRIPTAGSPVRVQGTVCVVDQAVARSTYAAPAAPRVLRGSMTPIHGGGGIAGRDPWFH